MVCCELVGSMPMELADDLASKQSSSKYYLSPTGEGARMRKLWERTEL